MRRSSTALLLAFVIAPLVASSAQEKRSDTLLTVDHYLDFEQVGEPQISPDGKQIVYARRYVNKIDDRWDSALWIMNADGSHHRMLGKGASPTWSPDGTRLAYLADQTLDWWLTRTTFFDVERERIWIFWRRVLHTSHHRTQLTLYLRLLDRVVPATYGPTADVTWDGADPTNTIAAASRSRLP